jgi:hypothetical protein
MPVGQWAWLWFRARFQAERGAGRAVIAVLAALFALVYIVTALWFDLAYWCLARFAADRVGGPARVAFSAAVAILVFATLSVSGSRSTAGPTAGSIVSQAAVALATNANPASASTQSGPAPPSVAPATQPGISAAASPTAADADDETGPTSAPGASFTAGPTGLAFVPVAGSPADRLPGEPDPTLTPGALNPSVTQATIGSTICVSGWTATVRPPSDYTTGLKIEQMSAYGYSDTSTADYEEDHLIPLELGGSPTDPRNLWPEPYTDSLADGRPTGAHVKDGFETSLKYEVCDRTITLAQAQSEIGDHWVHAYYGIALSGATPAPTAAPAPTPASAPTPAAAPTPPPAATLSVTITSLPASISHGSNATMTAATAPGASCSARVVYASGTVSTAAGLQTTPTADASGNVSWTWKVGTSTGPGTSTASVTCSLGGQTASASQTFQVT